MSGSGSTPGPEDAPGPQHAGPPPPGYGPPPQYDAPPPGYGPAPEYGPPPQYGPPHLGYGAAQPGPSGSRRKSRVGWVLLGVCVAFLVASVGLFVARGGLEQRFTIGTPQILAGLQRDQSTEAALAPQIEAMRTQVKAESFDATTVSAFYIDPRSAPVGGLPAGLILVGGNGDLGINGAENFIKGFKEGASQSGAPVADTDPGPNGGRAACAELTVDSTKIIECAWATGNTFGVVIPTSRQTLDSTAELMRTVRTEVETEE